MPFASGSDKLIIEVQPNEGSMRAGDPRMSSPHIPYSPEEIGRDVLACYNAGASVVHFHGRRPQTGEFEFHNPELNIATMRAIQARCPIVAYPTAASGPGCYA